MQAVIRASSRLATAKMLHSAVDGFPLNIIRSSDEI